jgi:hypothetical protein
MMGRPTLLMIAILSLSTVSSGAQQGTREEREACRPDVKRLCFKRDADENETPLACLQRNSAKLSRACRAVLERYGQL